MTSKFQLPRKQVQGKINIKKRLFTEPCTIKIAHNSMNTWKCCSSMSVTSAHYAPLGDCCQSFAFVRLLAQVLRERAGHTQEQFWSANRIYTFMSMEALEKPNALPPDIDTATDNRFGSILTHFPCLCWRSFIFVSQDLTSHEAQFQDYCSHCQRRKQQHEHMKVWQGSMSTTNAHTQCYTPLGGLFRLLRERDCHTQERS